MQYLITATKPTRRFPVFRRLVSLLLLLVLALPIGCTTVRPDPTPSCNSVFVQLSRTYTATGYERAAPVENQPTGQLAVFSDGSAARLVYLAYSAAIDEYLVGDGWESRGPCRTSAGDEFYILLKSVDLEKKPGQEASK